MLTDRPEKRAPFRILVAPFMIILRDVFFYEIFMPLLHAFSSKFSISLISRFSNYRDVEIFRRWYHLHLSHLFILHKRISKFSEFEPPKNVITTVRRTRFRRRSIRPCSRSKSSSRATNKTMAKSRTSLFKLRSTRSALHICILSCSKSSLQYCKSPYT